MKKTIERLFFVLVLLSLLTPLWVFSGLLFPFVTSKAFYFRILIELGLPLYTYLLLRYPEYRPRLKNPVSALAVLFVVFSAVSALAGSDVNRSLWGNFERMGGVFYLLHLLLLYFYVLLLDAISPKYFQRFLQGLVGMGVVVSVWGLMVWVTRNHFLIPDSSFPRISATLGNPIFLASFLVLPIFLSLMFGAQAETKRIRNWYLVAAAVQVLLVFMSGTRGAIVGLLVGGIITAIIYLWLSPYKTVKRYTAAVLGGGVAILALLFIFSAKLPEGTTLRRIFTLRDANTEARLIQWKTAWRGFKDRPILGTGPENYYIVSDRYYDPEIYKYDKSWFDKPHNYPLEILVTTGIVGFAAYAGLFLAILFALWRAYRAELYGPLEFALLTGGFVAYQIQNLFVFDTVSASIAFFVFGAFGGYLWHNSSDEKTQRDKEKKSLSFLQNAAPYAGGVVAVAALYVIYAANVSALQASKRINYGYSYASVSTENAGHYFESARDLPFNVFKYELALRYLDSAGDIATAGERGASAAAKEYVEKAIESGEEALHSSPKSGILLQQLANVYLLQAFINDSQPASRGIELAQNAMEVSPGRPELKVIWARYLIFQNKFQEAIGVLERVVQDVPDNADSQAQLAMLYSATDQAEVAAATMEKAVRLGYRFSDPKDLLWLAGYYQQQNKPQDAIRIYEYIVARDTTNNVLARWQLAQLYAQAGRIQEAIRLAEVLKTLDTEHVAQFQNFIDSLSIQ